MDNPLEHLISSLMSHRSSAEHPIVPDGVVDLSEGLRALTRLGKDGRVLHSEEPFHVADLIAAAMGNPASPHLTREDLLTGLFSIAVLVARLVDVCAVLLPDMSLEEILMHVASQDEMRALAEEFSAVPYITDADGTIIPCVSLHPLFSRPRSITEAMVDGFIRREIVPVMREVYESENRFEVDEENPQGRQPQDGSTIRFVNVSDFNEDDLTADRHNDFDEFYERYFENEEKYLNEGNDED